MSKTVQILLKFSPFFGDEKEQDDLAGSMSRISSQERQKSSSDDKEFAISMMMMHQHISRNVMN